MAARPPRALARGAPTGWLDGPEDAARLVDEWAGRVDEAASTELGAHDPLRSRLRDSQVRTLAESAPPVTDPARTTPRSDLLR